MGGGEGALPSCIRAYVALWIVVRGVAAEAGRRPREACNTRSQRLHSLLRVAVIIRSFGSKDAIKRGIPFA